MKFNYSLPKNRLAVNANPTRSLADYIADAEARKAQIRSSLSMLTERFPKDSAINVRALGRFAVNSYYVLGSGFDAMVEDVIELDGRADYQGIYATLNPCIPDIAARGRMKLEGHRVHGPKEGASDNEIARRLWLPFDLDPKRPPGISATDDEQAQALSVAVKLHDALRERFRFGGGIVASSGNGAHLLYPTEMENSPAAIEAIKQLYAVVERMVAELAPDTAVTVDRSIFNAGRVWRVYGTTTRKGDNTPERPHRVARILAPEEIEHLRGV